MTEIGDLTNAQLENRIFKYDSSEGDKRFFKQRIIDFLNSSQEKSFTQFMFEAIHERNGNGMTLKYCFFNEHLQKVFIDKYFYLWMKRMSYLISTELEKIKL